VGTFGQLKVDGPVLRSADGKKVQLKGISSMWLNWENDGYAESLSSLLWVRDNWHVSVIRAAMGVEPGGAYLNNPAHATQQVETIVQNAIEAGVYVIIDWHMHGEDSQGNTLTHQAKAEEFFSLMAEKYGEYPNVMYEPWNEPKQVDWNTVVKPYHEAVLAKIRAKDPDNIVIFGTTNWSQNVDTAARNPIAGTNLMYTLHFYSCTHQAQFQKKGDAALNAGVALFVTEYGGTHADGGIDGIVCDAPTKGWFDWMDVRGISSTAWKLDNCGGVGQDGTPTGDSSCLLKQGAPVDGPWTDEWLHGHAPLVRDYIKTVPKPQP
jgi:endoglucanase